MPIIDPNGKLNIPETIASKEFIGDSFIISKQISLKPGARNTPESKAMYIITETKILAI